MKRMLTLGCRLLAIYFGTLALTLFLADALRGQRAWAWEPVGLPTASASTLPGGGGEDRCPDCTEAWVRSSVFLKGIECQHGPHRPNSGCPSIGFDPEEDCWELNGGKPSRTTNVPCFCFTNCQSELINGRYKCEGEFLIWLAWCGEDLAALNKHCNLDPGDEQWSYVRPAYTNDNKQCTAPRGHGRIRFCGYDKVFDYGCVSAQCQPEGDFEEESRNRVLRCLPIPGRPLPSIPPAPTSSLMHLPRP